jgi:hypothetical protein
MTGDREGPQLSSFSPNACRVRYRGCANDLICGRTGYEVFITCLAFGLSPTSLPP